MFCFQNKRWPQRLVLEKVTKFWKNPKIPENSKNPENLKKFKILEKVTKVEKIWKFLKTPIPENPGNIETSLLEGAWW